MKKSLRDYLIFLGIPEYEFKKDLHDYVAKRFQELLYTSKLPLKKMEDPKFVKKHKTEFVKEYYDMLEFSVYVKLTQLEIDSLIQQLDMTTLKYLRDIEKDKDI